MKIQKWDEDKVLFEDGTTITYEHDADCCEWNWADFSVLDVFYHGEEFDGVKIETVDEMGFKLMLLKKHRCTWGWHKGTPSHYWSLVQTVVIPCYSDQNGYYSTNLRIVVTDPDGTKMKYDLECLLREDGTQEQPDFHWEKEEE